MNNEIFHTLIERHINISRSIGKAFLKMGKKETSIIIEHKAIIIDGIAKLKTEVTLLPIRRMSTYGTVLVDDEEIIYEMTEDIEI